MTFRVFILSRAQKELERLPKGEFERVREVLLSFANDPRPVGYEKLKGREGWRVRVGNYRVIYEIDDKEQSITILRVRHRKDAYR